MIEAAAALGGLGALAVLLSRSRLTLAGGFAALFAAEVAIARELLPSGLSGAASTPKGVAALVLGVTAVAAAVAAFTRFPSIVPVFLLAAAPFRLSIRVGDESAFLLVPLYAVLAAAAAALVVGLVRGSEPTTLPRAVAVPVGGFVALAAVSTLWADDLRGAGIALAFFLFPFTALVATVGRAPIRPWTGRALATTLAALGCFFALVGLWQVGSGNLFFAPDVEVANAYTSYDRVTSLFNDASVYGRHLALALVVVVLGLWLARVNLALGAAVVALLWTGLYFSYSQSSMLALFVGVLAVTLAAAPRRARLITLVTAVAATLVGAGVVAAAARDESIRRVTSGRSDLVENAVAVIKRNPVVGVGIGGEKQASRQEARARGTLAKPSHTTPLTVAAELGVLGLLACASFLVGAALALARLWSRQRALAIGAASVLVVLATHSLFYSGFFEDPIMWGTVAVTAGALAGPRAVSESRLAE